MTTTSRDVLAVVRRLADDVLFPEAMRVDRLTVLPAAQLDALAAEGLYGAPVPVQAGGLGLDLETYCAVTEELASGSLTTTFIWLQHRGLAMTLAAEGTPAALRDRWLGPVCQGTLRGGIALAGIIPGPPLLRARSADGRWRLDGEAPWVTGWGLIDLLLVQARGPGESIVTLILDAAAQPGLTVTRQCLAAVNASVTVRLSFDGVLVPGSAWSAWRPSIRPRACVRIGCASTGRLHSAWPAGAVGCSVPGRSTTSWPPAGSGSTRRSPPTRPRWRRPARRPRSWPSALRRRWRCAKGAVRSPWTSTLRGSPAKRCSCWCSGRGRESRSALLRRFGARAGAGLASRRPGLREHAMASPRRTAHACGVADDQGGAA